MSKEPKTNEIVEKRQLAPSITLFKLYVPDIAKKARPGQFVVLRADDYAERIPLTIADFDREKGLVTVIFQVVGTSTQKLDKFQQGQIILDVVGPLGKPSHIEKFGTVVCVGGGVGVAPVYPIAKALFERGNEVINIIGSRTKEMLILEDEMKAISSELFVTTDDGTYGHHGFVTDVLKKLIADKKKIDLVIGIGPIIMMRAVAEVTRPHNIHTVVSLNTIMVDGTGMCGCCRATVGGETKFVCVDGPEFDGHKVEFNELMMRGKMYNREERRAMWDHKCKLEAQEKALKKSKIREPMPEQNPKVRMQNFNEVALGYSRESAIREASRCLNCKNMPCVDGCPVNVQIPKFIKKIKEGDFMGAIHTIKETNSLPAVCGRVCPQETQCEEKCVLNKKGQPIAIGRLERFAADYELSQGDVRVPDIPKPTGKKVAIVGAGPAGLTVAGELAKKGHEVTIFEALHKAGGVLVYGIPEFRLPKAIVQREVDYVGKLGVKIKVDTIIGQTTTVDELFAQGYDAIFVGTGAGLPYFMDVPGENLNGVYSANEFLTRANLMKAYLFPEYDTPVRVGSKVAVIGGGNVAMDAARVSKRMGADNVYLIYRRSRAEMPARAEEAHHAEEEEIDFRLLTAPVRVIGDENGWVKGIECVKMELGEPDASGRRRPVEVKGSNHIIDVDVIVVAIGQGPNPILTSTTEGLKLRKTGNIEADTETGRTSRKGVFAGGDIVTGAATVILAMGAGRKAAASIDEYLTTGQW
ncbi:MAG TPA: bifunctional dihydroorotate dehydrogenase B NAD binding subunit/NADPH-dependent glutamate synthase [Syntrophorhabdaceae bacterium]|jgi:glutamate synthase (NADPH/NADH) small chain|nr:bifunctional dihydroorotate dehydrogenase B NAD binding subunit/NADPH-dependent glutamate synthase [Syntrophorhabdaceae bacterium]MDI9560293.1 bifunctional dihydroorotate dehydrogenase B NAD binding subunit/NADPH-dependent glutamate synthase [Pseudomonadota bacterium]OQC48757.1 MAG: Glutamate synthase (NADPH) small chain [Deltaproteobacteria bacterium ADurb.Bin026]MBP8697416.1 bifunctional dihydroorotate dehydrogenase B NAD binding subunit/NADPH-dependent glutamate synthase [Syntrophorhabdace